MRSFLSSLLSVLALLVGATGHAQSFLDTTLTLGKQPDAVIAPFTIAVDGTYRVTATDFGVAASVSPPLARLDVGIAHGSTLVARVTGSASVDFTATAGDYRAIVIGQPSTTGLVGSAGVRVASTAGGSTAALDAAYAFAIPGAPVASPATFEHEIAIAAAGTYTLEITDFALDAPLGSIDIAVLRGSSIVAQQAGGGQLTIAAGSAGTYKVIVLAALATGATHGLVGVNVRDAGTGAVQFAVVDELGSWPFKFPFHVNAPTALSGQLTDLSFPLPLQALGTVIANSGRLVATQTGTGPIAAAVDAGDYVAYVHAVESGASGAGSFGLRVSDAAAVRLLDVVQSAVTPGPTNDVGTVDTAFDVAAAGNYTLTLVDFGTSGFFDAFTSVALALTRDSAIVGTLTAPGTLTFTAATPGHYSVAIVADPAGADGEGLLGVTVRNAAAATVFERTEAVGADFISSQIDVTTATSVDVVLADLAFPASFASVKVAVTRGAERAGEIIGAGQFSFAATPGTYFVNLLAAPNAAAGYGTLGVAAAATPAAPTVALSSSAASVQAGGSVTLTWSSANVTSCVASNGWTGARATSGSVSSGALAANTTFVLSCTGAGGSKSASVTVAVTAEQRSHGGGSVDWLTALALGSFLVLRRRAAARAARA